MHALCTHLPADNAHMDGYPGAQQGVMATTDRPGSLGALLQHLRAAAGLSQEEIASTAAVAAVSSSQ